MLDTSVIKSQFLNFPGGPPKDMSVFQPPEPRTVTLFGKRIFAEIIKDLYMRSPCIIPVGPKFNDKCPYKKTQKKSPFEDRGRDWSYAATSRVTPGNYQKLEGAKDSLPEP